MEKCLKQIAKSCRTKVQPYPKYCWTDNCCKDRLIVQNCFRKDPVTGEAHEVEVCQDIKHIADRFIESLVKSHPLYLSTTKDVHGALVGSGPDCHMKSRNGQFYAVPRPLDDGTPEGQRQAGEDRIKRFEQLLKQRLREAPDLFRKAEKVSAANNTMFGEVLERQRYHLLNCMKESYIEIEVNGERQRVHAIEKEDGVFHLLRGTNRNESWHHALNHMWPQQIADEDLSDALLTGRRFSWNFLRYNGMCRDAIKGMDPSCIRISNVRSFKILDAVMPSTTRSPYLLVENNNLTGSNSSLNRKGKTSELREYGSMKNHNNEGSHKSSKRKKVTFTQPTTTSQAPTTDVAELAEIEQSGVNLTTSIDDSNLLDIRSMTAAEIDLLMTTVENSNTNSSGQLSWKQIAVSCAALGLSYPTNQLKQKYFYQKKQKREHSTSHFARPMQEHYTNVTAHCSRAISNDSDSNDSTSPLVSVTANAASASPVEASTPFDADRLAVRQPEPATQPEKLPLFRKPCQFTTDQIQAKVLAEPPKKTKFTDAEVRVYEYLLYLQSSSKHVNWVTLKKHWNHYAKLYALENPECVLYNREKGQLEQRRKDDEKKADPNRTRPSKRKRTVHIAMSSLNTKTAAAWLRPASGRGDLNEDEGDNGEGDSDASGSVGNNNEETSTHAS